MKEGQCDGAGNVWAMSSRKSGDASTRAQDAQPTAVKALERQLLANSLENMDINEAEQAVNFMTQGDNFLNVYLLGAVNGALGTNMQNVEETKKIMFTGVDKNYIRWGD